MRYSTASVLVLLLLTTAGCSGFVVFSNGTLLVAVTVDPTVADPRSFPNFTVPFVAAGSFNGSNSPVPLNNVLWTVESPFFNGGVPNSGHASIDQNGNATCASGFAGSVLVFATVPLNASQPISITNNKVGSAKLICP
jgi:hypothetical protein